MPSLPSYDVARCERCGARIRWTVTAHGARQAVDADPHPDGRVAVYRDGVGRLRSRQLSRERPTLEHAEWLAMAHAATCATPTPRRRPRAPRQRRGVRPVRWQHR